MLFFKQLGIAIGLMIVLAVIIWILNKTEKYANYGPYDSIDYVNNPRAFRSQFPAPLRI